MKIPVIVEPNSKVGDRYEEKDNRDFFDQQVLSIGSGIDWFGRFF
jgi:hypothetical protein